MKMMVDDVIMMIIHHQHDVVAMIENVMAVVSSDAITILFVPINIIIRIVVPNLVIFSFLMNLLTHIYSDHERHNNRQREDRNQDPDEFSTYGRPHNNQHGDGFSRNRPR